MTEKRFAACLLGVLLVFGAGFGTGYYFGFVQGWKDTWSAVPYLEDENRRLSQELKKLTTP